MNKEVFKTTILILQEIDRICKKHDIQYWVFFGTLIGTIRHKGFIPWDDDVDLCMKRSDFERFSTIAKTELGSDFFFQFYDTEEYYDRFVSRVRKNNTTYICNYEKNTVKKFGAIRHMGFFISIFPLDNYIGDLKKYNKQKKLFQIRLRLLQSSMRGDNTFKSKLATIYCNVVGRKNIHKRMHNAFRRVKPNSRNEMVIADIFNEQKKPWLYFKEDFDETIYMDFENIKVPVPIGYDRILKMIYGDYMSFPPEEQQHPTHILYADPHQDYKDFIKKNRAKFCD